MELSRTTRGVEIDWETAEQLQINRFCHICNSDLKIMATQGERIIWASCDLCKKDYNIPVR